MKRWCVVQTKSNQESTAAYELKKKNFDVYLPIYTVITKTRKGIREEKIKPLFPSYMFVAVDETDSWRDVNNVSGVVCLIGCSEQYRATLPIGWVEDLKERLLNAPPEDALNAMITYVKGEQVEVVEGGLKGHIGVYLHNSDKKIVLLLSLLGKENKISLPLESVRPLPT